MRYRIAEEDVLFEEYQDETIMANLNIGAYYTLDLVGSDFLRALILAPNIEIAESWLHSLYPDQAEHMKRHLATFIDDCMEEQLLIAHDEGEADPDLPVPQALQASTDVFGPPVLTKYMDIEDVLKFDPVHEVEPEHGWPTLADDKV